MNKWRTGQICAAVGILLFVGMVPLFPAESGMAGGVHFVAGLLVGTGCTLMLLGWRDRRSGPDML